jgi:hypothetical protein
VLVGTSGMIVLSQDFRFGFLSTIDYTRTTSV